MLYLVKGMDDRDSQILINDMENLERGTIQVEEICCVIASYKKYAETVALLAKNVRNKLYQYKDEMIMMSMHNNWGVERFVNEKVSNLFVSLEDDIREMQKIVTEEENNVVEVIMQEMEVTVADATCLAGLRKCIEICKDMVASLFFIMQLTSKYVDILGKDGGIKND